MSQIAPSYDLSIVGGGILGTMVAYRAAIAHPDRTIALIDRQQFGRGATQYAAALSSTMAGTQIVGQLSQESDRFYTQLLARDPSLPIRNLPILYILEEAKSHSFTTTGHLRPVEFEAVQARLPLSQIATNDVLLQSETSLHIDALDLVNRLVQKLKQLPNVDLFENQTVAQVLPSRYDSMHTIVTEPGESALLQAKKVLLALGPWSKSSSLSSGVLENGPTHPVGRIKKVVSMSLEVTPPPNCPVIFFVREDSFLLPYQDRFIFSICSDEWDVNPERPLKISDRDREQGRLILERYAPATLEYYRDGQVFCDCYSHDGHPIVQQHPEITGVVVATGGHGRGVRLAPAITNLALNLIDHPSKRLAALAS